MKDEKLYYILVLYQPHKPKNIEYHFFHITHVL